MNLKRKSCGFEYTWMGSKEENLFEMVSFFCMTFVAQGIPSTAQVMTVLTV